MISSTPSHASLLFLFLFSLSSFFNFSCSYTGNNAIFCPEIEKTSLLIFKQSLKDPYNLFSSWDGEVNCCQWHGVICNNSTGHVHELHLQGLSGKLNPSLLDLKHLTYLDLSLNSFAQTIPPFLGSFVELEYLSLSNAGFHGKIPHVIGNLSSLHSLNLESNYDGQLDVDSLEWLWGLSKLEYLNMNFVNLSRATNWAKAQPVKVNELSSSDSSLSKKRKSRRQKSVPAPSKKTTTPRVSPRSTKYATAGKASVAISRKYVGQSSTPTLTSTDETVSVQMINEAHSSRFVSQFDHAALSVLKSREFRSEKRINPPMFIKYGIDVLLKERGLWLTLTNVFPYNLNVVREFYANLSPECGVVESPRYGKVYIRGSVYSFSPEVINELFGLPSVDIPDWCLDGKVEKVLVTELTGGKIKKWDSRFQSTKLTCKYAVLHKIAVACWMLSKNTQILTKDQALMIYRVGKAMPFNFGQFVFNAVLKASSDPTGSLFYPNVIFQVLTGQGLDVAPSEGVDIEQLTFSNSLLSSDRKQDLPYKSKASRKAPVPSDSDDSLFEEINQFKGSAAAGPSGHSVSKSVRVVLASLPSLIQTAESLVSSIPSLVQSVESLVQALKDAQDVLKEAAPSLSDAES